jgi:hypothetical protein
MDDGDYDDDDDDDDKGLSIFHPVKGFHSFMFTFPPPLPSRQRRGTGGMRRWDM